MGPDGFGAQVEARAEDPGLRRQDGLAAFFFFFFLRYHDNEVFGRW